MAEDEIRKELKGVSAHLVLSGHSHTSFIGSLDEISIFNVGSVGYSLNEDKKISYGILNFYNKA